MAINRIRPQRLVILLFAFSASDLAMAQSVQLVQDDNVGVRLSIPKNWEYRSRERDMFIDCAPGNEDRGRPACVITVAKRKAPLDQKAITDVDRGRWKGWSSPDSSAPIISTGDIKVAGFPAYEVVTRSGTERDSPRYRRVFVLVPGTGVFDFWFATMLDDRDYDRYSPAFATAIDTLTLLK
jgi:hypothetical protein